MKRLNESKEFRIFHAELRRIRLDNGYPNVGAYEHRGAITSQYNGHAGMGYVQK